MCETRDRINCPAVGSYDNKEMKPVRYAQQGGDWSDYNDKCVGLGFPRVATTTTTTTTTTAKPSDPPYDSSKTNRRTGTVFVR